MIDTNKLQNLAQQYGISLTEAMLMQFSTYADLLCDWNQKMNLTAITAPDEIVIKHFLDSLILFPQFEKKDVSVIDIGSGAGFPGIPLKIAGSDFKLTMLDSLRKRVDFLEAISNTLKQDNVCIHGRAEETAHKYLYRESYDYAVARAVAALPQLCEYCLPFVKPEGMFIAYKGPEADKEIDSSIIAIKKMGGEFLEAIKMRLPGDICRTIIKIKKISQTPTIYPRKFAKILKTPLQ